MVYSFVRFFCNTARQTSSLDYFYTCYAKTFVHFFTDEPRISCSLRLFYCKDLHLFDFVIFLLLRSIRILCAEIIIHECVIVHCFGIRNRYFTLCSDQIISSLSIDLFVQLGTKISKVLHLFSCINLYHTVILHLIYSLQDTFLYYSS